MWSEFLIAVIGWVSAYRIIRYWRDKKVISKQTELRFIIFLLLTTSFSFFLGRFSPISVWFVQCFGILISLFFPSWIELRQRQTFQDQIITVLDLIILSMRSGKSFRESLQRDSIKTDSMSIYFSEIFELIHLRQTNNSISSDPFINRVYYEMKAAEHSQHKVIERLKSFRYVLKIEESFRQKSQQAALQARAQSMILSFIYITAAGFVIIHYGWKENLQTLSWSLILFVLGTVWIWKLGRSHQWKI